MKVIYESKRPKFAISKDRFQWILATKKRKDGSWGGKSYHPNLANLLDELAEQHFRRFTTKLKDIKDLNNSIDKVYDLIFDVTAALQRIT